MALISNILIIFIDNGLYESVHGVQDAIFFFNFMLIFLSRFVLFSVPLIFFYLLRFHNEIVVLLADVDGILGFVVEELLERVDSGM